MMTEISLNVLDVAQNSVGAHSNLIQIEVTVNNALDKLSVVITDDGCGMTAEQVSHVDDPFFTTRTTRTVGLGVPFFKHAALITGGEFSIHSEPGKGTVVIAIFILSHIDRMPLGDMTSTMHTLITLNTCIDFIYSYQVDEKGFTLDTREFRKILGDVPFSTPEVSTYIKEFLQENTLEINQGRYI